MLRSRMFVGAVLTVSGGLMSSDVFAQAPAPCAPYRQSQNFNPDDVVNGASIICGGGIGDPENRFCRSYDLSACSAAGNNILVSCVSFAVEFNTVAGYVVEVNIYEDTDGGAPTAPGGDLLLLGTTTVVIPVIDTDTPEADTHFQANFDLDGGAVEVPANAIMVVELHLPERATGIMSPGVNNTGEDEISYLLAPACGISTYEAVGALGFPGAMLIQTVDATLVEAVEPCPGDCADQDGTIGVADLLMVLTTWGQPGQSCNVEGIADTVDVGDLLVILTNWGLCPQRPAFCEGDTDSDNSVNVSDLLTLLISWGPSVCSTADFDFSGSVNVADLLTLLTNWGPCPQ